MRFSFTTIVSLVTASATLVSSASIMRPDGDNGSCAQLHRICAGQVQYDLNNVWAVESCLFAGVCYERQGANLDNFLGALWQEVGHSGAPPNSLTTQRVPPPVSSAILHFFLAFLTTRGFTRLNTITSSIGLCYHLEGWTDEHSAELHRRIL